MLELESEFRLLKRPLGLPIDLWPLVGFRFQRFDMTAQDGTQLVSNPSNPVPVGYQWNGIEGTFNQQYYISYAGAQLRATIGRDARRRSR